MKICDLTQFYSPFSGGVKRYLHEKIAYIKNCSPEDEHVLIVPGPKTEVRTNPRSRVYSIRSPLVSRSSRYRALLNLRAIEEILEREQPDLIESSDPYQIGWKAIAVGRALKVPVVGFYHSHFPEAYLKGTARFLGKRGTLRAMKLTRAYVRKLYNRFQATLVPSERLAELLSEWGVHNVRPVRLGVNTEVFNPTPDDTPATRHSLGVEATKSCCSTWGVWRKKKIPKHCLAHLSFCVCETGINFICWSSAMDRSDTEYKSCGGALETVRG